MKLKEKLSLLPDNPGCYLMKDKFDNIIYVGKAKNLKSRVKSYFTGAHNYKTTRLVSEIVDFDLVLTNSEQESLILELNLIKEHRPKYNIVFMDDKTYPYIEITNTIPPTIKVVRTKSVKGRLFGPYPNVRSARETARLLELLFPMGRVEKIPNFYEEIGEKIESDKSNNYKEQVNIVTRFLKGDTKLITNHLEEAMAHYSDLLMFERALVIRDQLDHLKNVTEKQLINLNDFKDRDFIGTAYNDDDVAIQILFMRSGRIIDQHQMIFSYVGDPKEFIISYLLQFYENHYPDEILFDNYFKESDLELFENVLIPKIGDKRKIVELATKNASHDLENHFLLYRNRHEQNANELDELSSLLNISNLNLIETFDNSQLFGTAKVSAMVVYENGKFNRKLYRKYHLKSDPNDDYMALEEVIYRRYRRVLMDQIKKPDLILVDGGKGHVNIAKKVLNDLNLDIKVCGIKKNDRHQLTSLVYNNLDIDLKEYKDAFKLLAKISEEVHRYAISFHKQTRAKAAYKSPLDNVKGLGSVRKRTLLTEFNNLDEIYTASEIRLRELGIPTKVIKELKEVLKNEINR